MGCGRGRAGGVALRTLELLLRPGGLRSLELRLLALRTLKLRLRLRAWRTLWPVEFTSAVAFRAVGGLYTGLAGLAEVPPVKLPTVCVTPLRTVDGSRANHIAWCRRLCGVRRRGGWGDRGGLIASVEAAEAGVAVGLAWLVASVETVVAIYGIVLARLARLVG